MANSKSNIYPIQLQGAELNLNKLDAEIKQYSGFNKNNSPFVGGCLSNVFHKEETIEDADDNNTYIDENGDVYRVTTEGLFKNDEAVLSFENGDLFFKCEEIETTALYVFSDKIQLYKRNGLYYLNDSIGFNLAYDFDVCLKLGFFTGVFYENYFIFIARTETEGNYIIFLLNASTGAVLDYKTYLYDADSDLDVERPLKVLAAENRIGLLFTFHQEHYRMNIYSIENNELTLDYEKLEKTNTPDNLDFTYFYYSSYPVNIMHHRSYAGSSFSLNGFIARTNLEVTNGKLDITVDSFSRPSVSQYVSTLTEQLGMFYCDDVVGKVDNSHYFTIHRVLDVLKGRDGFGASAKYPNNPLYCSFKFGDAVNIGNFTFLFNNGYLSGIASRDVLLSDWNIDSRFVTYKYNDFVCYKDARKWFKVSIYNKAALVRNGDWLVINKNGVNAYNIKRNFISQFAPSFNLNFTNNASENIMDITITTKYVAGAINEYTQENLSSIIINPVNVHYRGTGIPDVDYYNPVNFYSSSTLSSGIYYQSEEHGLIYEDKDLEGLPFPVNSDGNVEYSPNLFSKIISVYGNETFIQSGDFYYPLRKNGDNENIFSFYLASGIAGFEVGFIIQGQFYGIINSAIYNITYYNGVVANVNFVVSVENLQFCGNTPYEALFFSKTNRCLYSFTGANVLNQKQFVDKISEVRNYLYNPATQTVFLITDIGVLFYGLFGMFLLEYTNITNIFLLDNGIVMSDNSGNYRYIKYYLDEGDTDYTKENIRLETCFYGMNNEVVTINDCLYFRLFSEEHEEGNLKVSATTISLSGRKTEETTFKIKASDWDKITHTIYLRYQPKSQRGLGVSFSIDSPFKIASMSVGSQPDAVLVDRVSKGAITAPSVTTNNNEW